MIDNNLLIQADNIDGLYYLLQNRNLAKKIELVYIDPPFATNNVFTVSDERFSTTSRPQNGLVAYADTLMGNEYLKFLRKRLELIYELLSPIGSIYLHIDYQIGHYVKVIMDSVFGIDNFRNDITRIKCNPKNFSRLGYGNIKDMILFYTKSKNAIWNEPIEAYTSEDIARLFKKKDEEGRRYTTVPLHAPGETTSGESGKPFKGIFPPEGRHWRTAPSILEEWDQQGLIEWSVTGNPRKKIFEDEREGKRVQDIWEFKDPQSPSYPTEKNSDLLDRIVSTSSNPDSIVLDCFCGSGTSLLSAQKLGRHWIGIDESTIAIRATINKFTKEVPFLPEKKVSFNYIGLEKNSVRNTYKIPVPWKIIANQSITFVDLKK